MATRRTILGITAAAPLAITGCAILSEDMLIDPFSEANILTSLQALDATPHLRTGHAGEQAILERTARHLKQSGFSLHRQPVQVPGFAARRTQLCWAEQSIDVFPQYEVVATGPDGVTGPLRIWQDWSSTSGLSGAIVLFKLSKGRHSKLLAANIRTGLDRVLSAGAKAVVIITEGPTGETIMLNAPVIGSGPHGRVPIVVLGPKHAQDVMTGALDGQSGTLIVDGTPTRMNSANLIGRLDRGRRTLVVSTPRTAWTPAVAERGPGYATFNALAEWAVAELRDTSLLFVSTAAHEFDNSGGRIFMQSDLAPNPDGVALWVHLGAGFAARDAHELGNYQLLPLQNVDAQRYLLGSHSLLPNLKRAFAGQPGLESPYPADRTAPGELGEVVAHGYEPAFGLVGAHRHHHVMNDRIAHTNPEWIRAAAIATRDAIESQLRGTETRHISL